MLRCFRSSISAVRVLQPSSVIHHPGHLQTSSKPSLVTKRYVFTTPKMLIPDTSANSGTQFAEEGDPRLRDIPVEISMKYMESAAYQETYGEAKVWELYRRNYANGRTYQPTRKNCIRGGKIANGNPCPICRDEYLVVDHQNLKLLNQFVSDYSGEILTSKKTGVCQHQWMKIRVELQKAKDKGLLKIDYPFVSYDYDKYRPTKQSIA
ncbi:hypothetical protein TCAL_07454 [Tigriopus californicus]|uniref:Small ribosomal subunit protein mS40 n=1 Tax=Tigriopus californicus TaxID=6832 RepID=A0A553N860_TIGCA|nr:small ribosomal subunit protein mS40-like [Tigriopus californicus]TRY61603.1 hypothetical protein TCAL_07454 [Tigriopus californicus]|eukprot:TCALIF_07454-PA protein Name:"Similar to MRPS18B 28S ribosomal protein S18b, mitochondrial (Macaca mulatta)" AED:0.01 eAED:0.02 QI:0/-1/0/1/-1/1/1/0/207